MFILQCALRHHKLNSLCTDVTGCFTISNLLFVNVQEDAYYEAEDTTREMHDDTGTDDYAHQVCVCTHVNEHVLLYACMCK